MAEIIYKCCACKETQREDELNAYGNCSYCGSDFLVEREVSADLHEIELARMTAHFLQRVMS